MAWLEATPLQNKGAFTKLSGHEHRGRFFMLAAEA
jgi:hypothetical protein